MTHGVREVVFTRTQMLHFYFCIRFKWCMNQNTEFKLCYCVQSSDTVNAKNATIQLYFNTYSVIF